MDSSIFDAYWAERQPDRSDMAEFWTRRASSFNAHGGEADSSAYRQSLVAKVAHGRAFAGRMPCLMWAAGRGGMLWNLHSLLAAWKAVTLRPV